MLTGGFVEEARRREIMGSFLIQYRPKVRLRLGYPFLTRHFERERLAQSIRVLEQLIWEITQWRVTCVEGEFQGAECGANVHQVVDRSGELTWKRCVYIRLRRFGLEHGPQVS